MTVENFKKAMEKADLLTLKQTEQNLLASDDKERLEVVRGLLSKFKAPKAESVDAEEKPKRGAKNGSS